MINKFRCLLLFVLVSCSFTSIQAYTVNVYEDPGNFTFFLSTSYMNNGFTYPDGTGLMQLYSNNNFNDLYIRLLHSDGTLTKLTFNDTGLSRQYACPLNDGYVLIIQIKDDNKYVYGKLVDWSGQVLQRDVMLADIPVTSNSTPIAKANIDPNKGFLVAAMDKNVVLWKIFSAPNSTHQIIQLYEGNLTGNDDKILQGYEIFPTIEGGYGIALLKSVSTFAQDPLISKVFHSSPQWLLYVTFWQPDTLQFDTPHLVWQNPNPTLNSTMIIKGCEVEVDGSGYFCIVEVPNDVTGRGFDYVRVAFLSGGSVTDVNVILDDTPQTQTGVFGIRQLPYGGFMSVERNITAVTSSYVVSVRGKDGTNVQTLELPDIGIADYAVFPNNTAWIGIRGASNISVVLIPLQKLWPEDAGFKNLLVESSTPPSGSSVTSDIANITLTFREQIVLSGQNISIYQITNGNHTLRQAFSAKSGICTVTSNDTAVTCPIFKSTFNKPGAAYDVVVDNDFVMSKSLNQPLSGVTEGNWVYYGGSTEGEYTESTTGLLRLTPEGTTLFNHLSTADKKSFLDSMVEKLAELIPVDPSLITTNRRNQPDPNTPTRQIVFPVTLQPSDDQSQRTVQQTIDDLDELVKNKAYNSFSQEYPTNYLDETYGFSPIANLWENYKFAVVGLLAGLLLLAILYYFTRRKNPEGDNFMVVKLTLILADLTLYTAFVLTSAKYVPKIFVISIVFLIIPLVINFGLALSILIREIRKNTKFQKWFGQNIKTVSLFTLLAAADVEVITVLGSKIAGLKMFSAPLSKIALNYVFWCGTVNLFLKDVPQLVVQILYRYLTVSYDIIPFLALVMVSIVLAFDSIDHFYDGFIRLKEKGRGHSVPRDETPVTVQEDE